MDIEHFKQKLLTRRQELIDSIARAEEEGRAASQEEVRDNVDSAVDDTTREDALRLGDKDSELLQEVDDALARIEQGTYGICTRCGEQIELARLEAIPWARYCLKDQEKLEKKDGPQVTPTL